MKPLKQLLSETAEALEDVLDSLGALSNHTELCGYAISEDRAKEIVQICKEAKERSS